MRKLLTLSAVVFVVAALGGGYATSTAKANSLEASGKRIAVLKWRIGHWTQQALYHDQLRFNMLTEKKYDVIVEPILDDPVKVDLIMRMKSFVDRDLRMRSKARKLLKRELARRQQLIYSLIGNVRNWLCIHRYEGAWNDPNAPYYGGLQMDYGFQQTYGPELLASKGTADNWTPFEQMMVAERARKSGRGYYPWPNTARACGLI